MLIRHHSSKHVGGNTEWQHSTYHIRHCNCWYRQMYLTDHRAQSNKRISVYVCMDCTSNVPTIQEIVTASECVIRKSPIPGYTTRIACAARPSQTPWSFVAHMHARGAAHSHTSRCDRTTKARRVLFLSADWRHVLHDLR